MQEAYMDVYGVPTKIVTCGKWVEETIDNDEPEDIVIIIPGNPGVTGFYKAFMKTLHEQLDYPVWILSHAGHESPENTTYREVPPLTDNERIYGLQGQVNHKRAFIENCVPKNARIHFVGHSIGAYIILELLKDPSVRERTAKSYFLFPTIEYMSSTPNGKILTGVIKHIVWLILLLAWIFTLLPSLLQWLLIKMYLMYTSVASGHFETIRNFVNPEILAKVFCMAFDEMALVKERNGNMLFQNKNKIKLYYGASDWWTPTKYRDNLQRDVPGIDAEICKRKFDHAFVLRQSEEVGKMVAGWIKP